jgi:hypothetical protein
MTDAAEQRYRHRMQRCARLIWLSSLAALALGCEGSVTGGADGAVATDAARVDGSAPRADAGAGADAAPEPGALLRDRYPGDVGIASASSVLFHDDFEGGWGRWDAPRADTTYLTMESDAARAHAGTRFLRSTVSEADLAGDMYISSQTSFAFDRRVDTIYWRFYARFPNVAPNPHHWVRMSAGDDTWDGSGRANMVPPGDRGFWFDFDIDNTDLFNFYVYWYGMRSGRCNDGSAVPGCAGDQGTTYYYGNVFSPAGQSPYPRDEWFCIEIGAHANTVGESDGWLAYWIDDAEIGRYAPGEPEGTWLRATFHEGGCDFSACTPPAPFEGFDFRTDARVGFKSFVMDAYYERDTTARRRAAMEMRGLTVSDEQTILYDDVVVAEERIGCRR